MRKKSKVDSEQALPESTKLPNKIKRWMPRNANQTRCWNSINENTVTFITGPAGCAKSHTAMSWAIDAVSKKQYEKIICTRPVVEAEGESLGWLPGDLGAKLQPFMRPLFDIAGKHEASPVIETIPYAYMRGLTFENSICVLDEAQNSNKKQLKLYLSRLGYGSKMVITGDLDQVDIYDSGLGEVINALRGVEGVGVFEFTNADICRHPIVGRILDRL